MALRGDMKQLIGWAPRPTHQAPVVARARPGQTEFSFQPLLRNNPTDIYVAVDGVMMTPNHDYVIDMTKGRIVFDNRVHRLDGGEEVEIRSTGPDVDPLQELILLPRKLGTIEFTDEQLQEFMEDVIGNVFHMEQLAKYNGNKLDKLMTGVHKQIQVKAAEIRPEGIVGTEQVVGSYGK